MVRWGAGGYLRVISGASAAAPVGPTDPFFSSVVLLTINDNQPNNSTTFTDQSSIARTVTAHGGAKYSTAQSPSGMTSSLALSANSDWIDCALSADFGYGTGDATIEGYTFFSSTAGLQGFTDQRDGSANNPMLYGDGGNYEYFVTGSNNITGAALVQGSWVHWAWSRVSGVSRMFLNGTKTGSNFTDSQNIVSSKFTIGNFFNHGNFFNGFLCSVRVTKGVGRYVNNFTAPSLPLPTQ